MIATATIFIAIFLLLLTPLHVCITLFDGKPEISLAYMIFHKKIDFFLSPKEKGKKNSIKSEKKAQKKKRRTDSPKKPNKTWDRKRIFQIVELILQLLKSLSRSGRFFLKGVHIQAVQIQVLAVGENAQRTAEESLKLQTAVYTALALLQNFTKIRSQYVSIVPAFWLPKEEIAFLGEIYIRPLHLLISAIFLICNVIPPFYNWARAQNEQNQTV